MRSPENGKRRKTFPQTQPMHSQPAVNPPDISFHLAKQPVKVTGVGGALDEEGSLLKDVCFENWGPHWSNEPIEAGSPI
jgi:hypothetical protein